LKKSVLTGSEMLSEVFWLSSIDLSVTQCL
jgi:hypothetical protein